LSPAGGRKGGNSITAGWWFFYSSGLALLRCPKGNDGGSDSRFLALGTLCSNVGCRKNRRSTICARRATTRSKRRAARTRLPVQNSASRAHGAGKGRCEPVLSHLLARCCCFQQKRGWISAATPPHRHKPGDEGRQNGRSPDDFAGAGGAFRCAFWASVRANLDARLTFSTGGEK